MGRPSKFPVILQTPHRAYGKAIQIPGYSLITTENVESASRAFLGDNAAILRINPRELKLTAARQVQGKWYVSFSQEKEGIQVLFSEVELRIFENGQVMAFGADFYRNIELSLAPSISYNEARSRSIKELMFDSATDRINGQEKLYILPRRIRREVEFHLVYKVEITTENPEGNFLAFVDAHNKPGWFSWCCPPIPLWKWITSINQLP
jgi:Zn-dependent metalloprotease